MSIRSGTTEGSITTQNAEEAFLSPRQAEIAQLVAAGKSTREIALALTLSPRTVETHIAAIYNKFGVSSRAELIIAFLGPGARFNENTAVAANTTNTNLPARRAALVGRAADLANVTNLLRESRLVTLTGAGGIGKTRAALAVGEAVLAEFTAGVWFVEFAALARGSAVADAVAWALGLKPSSGRPLIESLCSHLRRKSLVLIFDNCEHVIGEAAAVADALLRECPHLRIIATSREPLRIAGERAYRLPSLPVPSSADSFALDAPRGAAYASIELFMQRAQAADFAFTLTDENVSFVAEICRRIDGIPLAIELAAARVNILPVRVLATTLEAHLRILGGGDRIALPRHQTMHALIDWSYDLLEPQEQRLFERLSVFAGGCALPEAIAVYGDAADEVAILDMLSSLVDKSLVVVDTTGPQPRYSLLQIFTQYAFEKLSARGDAEALARRHAVAYVTLAERVEAQLEVERTEAWFARAEREIGNWRAALDWALEARHDVVLGQRLVAAMRYVWLNIDGAQRWLRVARELIDEQTPPTVAAAVRYTAACINFDFGQNERTVADCRQLSEEYEKLAYPLRSARSKAWQGTALFLLGRIAEAEPLLASALRVAREHSHRGHMTYCLDVMSQISFARGDIADGRAKATEAITICESIGDERGAALTRSNLADAEFGCGNIEQAGQLGTSSLIALRQVGLRTDIARALTNLAAYCIAADRWAAAHGYAGEAFNMMKDTQHYVLFDGLQHLAAVAALAPRDTERKENLARAARLLGYVDACSATLGYRRQANEQREFERVLAALRAANAEDVLASHMADGAAMAADQAIELAMSMLRLPP